MIRADARHRAVIEAVLGARPELAMFPLANLATHGMTGGAERAMTFWLDDPGAPNAILGVTNGGMVMPFWPDDHETGPAARALAGRRITGFAGPAGPVRALMRGLGMVGRPAALDADEPQFLLSLADLTLPASPGTLAPLTADRDTAIAWRRAYNGELHTGAGTEDHARGEVDRWIAADSHRFLMIDDRPAALTGFNARLPDIVQIGGVYTPPEARGRGLARRAVALHLAEAREAGATRATLFAASDAAVACYRPLGFRRIGDYALVLLSGADAA